MDPAYIPPTPRPPLRASRALAAFLSFLVPGTGQLVAGRVIAGLLFLLPVVVAIVGGVIAAGGDRGRLAGILVQPSVLLGIVIGDVVVFLWRSAAILDAWWRAKGPRTSVSTAVLVTVLMLTLATHVVVGAAVWKTRDTVDAVFATSKDPNDNGFGVLPSPTHTPRPTPTPAPGTTPLSTTAPTATPVPTPPVGPLADGRLDVLLVGGDAGPGRWSLRTDTLMLLSVDVKSGQAALFSIPRNMVNVPLPKESRKAFACACYPQLINSLYVYASAHPGEFPGNDDTRGLRAVQMAIGQLTGRTLDGMVVVKLQGFVRLINAIGGLDINVPYSIHDDRYPLEDGSGYVTVDIKAGKQHMTGRKALMFARSRHQDSDYGRMARQQIVISAIGKKLLSGSLITELPDLLDIAQANLWTNLNTSDLPDLVALAEQVNLKSMQTYRFDPPQFPEYVGRTELKNIRALVAHVFDHAKPLATPAP